MKVYNGGFTVFKRSFWVLMTVFMALLLSFCVVGATIANSYADIINDALGIDAYVRIQMNAGKETDMEYYKSDYVKKNADGSTMTETEIFEENGEEIGRYTYQVKDDEAMRVASEKVAEQTAVEGTVLLWNDEIGSGKKALPLDSGSNVSLFGSAQRTYTMYGKGSGRMNSVSAIGGNLKSAFSTRRLTVDPDLYNRYSSLTSYGSDVSDPSESYGNNYYSRFNVREAPWSEVEHYVDVSAYGDAAIMIINRNAGEDQDIRKSPTHNNMQDDYVDGTKNYLELSVEEGEVLEELNALKGHGLERIILVINTANPMQFKNITADKYGIDACLWVGMGGSASYMQIADALSGASDYVVSGRTADTLAMDNRSAPSYQNFGDFQWTDWSEDLPDLTNEGKGRYTTHNLKYIVYQEGVYVGYRYYETRYEDYVLNRGNAGGNNGATDENGWNYAEEVAFPFGYGLSYTDFSYSTPEFSEDKDSVTATVTVTNTGDYAGKEVVQLYMQRPYYADGIEKPAVELVGFAKTDKLYPASEAGEGKPDSQEITITIDKENMRTYDTYGAKTYILEQGNYYFAIGNNAHDALNNIIVTKNPGADKSRMHFFPGDGNGNAEYVYTVNVNKTDTEIYSVSEESGEEVEITNRISDADLNLYEGTADQHITYLSRNDWNGTYPEPVELECMDEKMVSDMQYSHPVEENSGDIMPKYEQDNKLTLAMFMDTPFSNSSWYDLIEQMSYQEQSQLVGRGFKMIAAITSIASPDLKAADGPAGVKVSNPTTGKEMAFPSEPVMAATWNTELIEQLGVAFGHEALHADVAEIYAPGANIHRSPYGGRNWEYFSEDGVLSGLMLCAEIKGIQSKGVIVMTKHFAINDQETNRYACATFFDEQTAREIYLRPFEIAIRQGDMNGVMSSFNRIGCTWIGQHKGMLTDILRNEWGFTGICQTDSSGNVAHMTGNGNTEGDPVSIRAEAVIAGTDLWLDGTAGEKLDWMEGSEDNATVALALREACHRILYNVLHSSAMNGIDSSTRIEPITVWWQYALMAVQIVIGVLLFACAVMLVLSFVFAAKNAKKQPAYANTAYGTAKVGGTSKTRVYADEKLPENNGDSGYEGEIYTGKRSWFARHKKLVGIIAGITAAVIIFVSIIVPVTTCGGEEAGPDPDVKPPVTTEHTCEHKCPICGGCIDLDCDEEACENKCGAGKEGHVFEAENAAREFGDNGYMSRTTENDVTFMSNVYGNKDAKLSFTVETAAATTASLSVTMTGYLTTKVFSDVLEVSVTSGANTATMTTTAEVPRNAAGTAGFNEVMLGCVQLGEGVNVITFKVKNYTALSTSDNGFDNGFDIDKITLYGGELSEDEHVCTMVCPDCGGCLDADCTDPACANKCGDAEENTVYIFEAENSVLGSGTGGAPKLEGNFVGNLSENEGATLTFTFQSASAGKATLMVGASYRNVERAFTDGFNVYVNDPDKTSPMQSSAPVPGARSIGGDWNVWNQSARVILGCIDVVAGDNTIVLEVKSDNTNTAFNIDYIAISSAFELIGGKEEVPVDPDVHVCTEQCPVCGGCMDAECEDAACANKCGDDRTQTTRLEAENAELTDGDKGGIKIENNGKYVGGLSENANAKVTFKFNVSGNANDEDLTATLYVGSTYRSQEIVFTNGFNIYVNGTLLEDRASTVPSSASIGKTGNVWDVTYMVNVGCVNLVEGENTITLEVRSDDAQTTTNLDCIELHTAEGLVVSEGASVETGILTIDAVTLAKRGPGVGTTNGKLPSKDGNVIGNISRNTGATLTFEFTAADAGEADLIAGVTRRSKELNFTDFLTVTVNGSAYESSATVPTTGADNWTTAVDVNLGKINIIKGVNTVKFTVATANDTISFNFGYIKLDSETEISAHVCGSVCEDCGKCMDADCDELGCEEKCADYVSVTYKGTEATLGAGSKGSPTAETQRDGLLGNMSGNSGATLTYTYNAASAGTVSLYVGVTQRASALTFANEMTVTVNEEEFTVSDTVKVPAAESGVDNWFDCVKVDLGDITVSEGDNTITFTVATGEDVMGFNFGYVMFVAAK